MKLTRLKLKEIIREEIKKIRTEQKRVQFSIPMSDQRAVTKVMQKLRLKSGKDYDYGVGRGSTFVLDLDTKYEDRVLELLIKNRVRVNGL